MLPGNSPSWPAKLTPTRSSSVRPNSGCTASWAQCRYGWPAMHAVQSSLSPSVIAAASGSRWGEDDAFEQPAPGADHGLVAGSAVGEHADAGAGLRAEPEEAAKPAGATGVPQQGAEVNDAVVPNQADRIRPGRGHSTRGLGGPQRVSQRSGLRFQVGIEVGQQIDTGAAQAPGTGEGVELPGRNRPATPMPGGTQWGGFAEKFSGGGG